MKSYTPEEMDKLGADLAANLHLKRDKEHKNRWVTGWGTKMLRVSTWKLILCLKILGRFPPIKYFPAIQPDQRKDKNERIQRPWWETPPAPEVLTV